MIDHENKKYINKQDLNATIIYCPRCSCVLLKESVARADQDCGMIELASIRKDETGKNPPFIWIVDDMMKFENIGFTRPLEQESGIKRYLTCADCDLGPLGAQTDILYLAGDRVKYEEP